MTKIPIGEDRQSKISALLVALPMMRSYAARLCHSVTENACTPDDLVQETVVRAIKYIDSFSDGDFDRWLRVIMKHQRDDFRHKVRGEFQFKDFSFDHLPDLAHEDSIRTSARVELPKVLPALASIKPRQSAAIIAVYYLNLEYAEAARVCKCELGTLKSRVNRGIKTLQELLEPGTTLRRDFSELKHASDGIAPDDPYYPVAKAYEELYAHL